MEVRILGPVEPSVPPKPAQILAVLAVECGKIVPVERLIDLIWGEEPPPQARKSLQVHISSLRRAGLPVEHRAAGYVLNAELESVDLHLFRKLVAKAHDETDLKVKAEALNNALQLWRGVPVVFAQTLDVQRLAAAEQLVDVELALGRHAELIEKLGTFVAEYPLAERLRGQLMTALARAGRPVLATCAGLILVARTVRGPEQPSLGWLDAAVERNARGRQLASSIETADGGGMVLPLIRAPRIVDPGSCQVLATLRGEPVLVRQGAVVGATFHPELTSDPRVHELAIGRAAA